MKIINVSVYTYNVYIISLILRETINNKCSEPIYYIGLQLYDFFLPDVSFRNSKNSLIRI